DRDIKQITDDAAFIERINSGSEWMPDDQVDRLERIKQYMWRNPDGETVPLLTENEAYNLEIRRGTLNAEERQAINDHIVVTIEMLETLPFPKNLKRVPEYAGGHHEKMDGTGYPKVLTRDQLSVPARMMAIADIFEALTAADRPYKKPKPLSESVGILKKMAEENHIDTELFELFVASEVHKEYAERFLAPEQNDHVDINAMLGAAAE
ncbi:MAG: HD domain-containing phosphohydrolase, partial [Pseudomonadota bacterium]